MRMIFKLSALFLVLAFAVSCKKNGVSVANDEIPQDVLTKISALGFGTSTVQKHEDGYLVEGDIVITPELLNQTPDMKLLRVGTEEQYRTTNLVTGLPRVITVSVNSRLPAFISNGTNEAIARYNAQGLRITFQRVASGGTIDIVKAGGNYLASAGFPSGGDPYGQVKVNSNALSGQPLGTVASDIAHEIGHCIGFRHTDYMNRAYSCGGSAVNEGASNVGAVHIPGTPTGPDPNSWMLSCIELFV
jgi:hypothetical protein